MKIDKVIIENYIPLKHGGTTNLEIDIDSNVICMIGGNGSGKSSTLRAIDFSPAISTDYPNGYKEIYLSSGNDNYILKSDFTDKATHSFVKNNEELNVSNNSTVQQSLCVTELGITPLIKDIMNGEVQITKIQKTNRRQLLMECYPSDLSFISDYHKNILSGIRVLKGNKKMLMGRETELSSKLIKDTEYENIQNIKDDLKARYSRLDNLYFALKNIDKEITTPTLRYNEELLQDSLNSISISRDMYIDKKDRVPYDDSNLQEVLSKLKYNHNTTLTNIETINTAIVPLVEFISKSEAMLNINIDEEIAVVNLAITHIEKERCCINDNYADYNLNLSRVTEDDISYINEICQELTDYKGYILTSDILNKHISELDNLTYKLAESRKYKLAKEDELAYFNNQLTKLKSSSYNKECNFKCVLKDSVDNNIEDANTKYLIVKEDLQNINNSLTQLESHKEHLVNKLQPSFEADRPLNILIPRLIDLGLLQHLADGIPQLVEMLNSGPTNISNRCVRIYNDTKNYNRLKLLNDELVTYKNKLTILENTKATGAMLSNKLLTDKALHLKYIDELKELKSKCDKSQIEISNVQELISVKSNLSSDRDRLRDICKNMKQSVISNYTSQLLSNLETFKTKCLTELTSIERTVDEQKNIRMIIESEIKPNIQSIDVELTDLENIEKALSPNSGAPYEYMLAFINSLIKTANTFISHVWTSELEFASLSRDKDLDFTFKICRNGNTYIPDCSMCSRGEQEIINLSFTLALAIHMGISHKFPLKLDEPDSAMSETHRSNLLLLLSSLIRNRDINQLFIVNHHSTLFTSFAHSQIVCLGTDGIVLPPEYNRGVVIT